jgi:hypothetical protein
VVAYWPLLHAEWNGWKEPVEPRVLGVLDRHGEGN